MLTTVLEAGMRKEDSNFIFDIMSKFVETKQEPHSR